MNSLNPRFGEPEWDERGYIMLGELNPYDNPGTFRYFPPLTSEPSKVHYNIKNGRNPLAQRIKRIFLNIIL